MIEIPSMADNANKDALLADVLAVQHTMLDLSKRIHAIDKENASLEARRISRSIKRARCHGGLCSCAAY